MDEFGGPFWNLDQVRGWAETRDKELVRAAIVPEDEKSRTSIEIALRAIHSATDTFREGRDIDAELWTISELARPKRIFVAPFLIERHASNLGIPVYQAFTNKNVRTDWPKGLPDCPTEIYGPPHVYETDPFPTIEYLELLFQLGRLQALENLAGKATAHKISAEDWHGLKIQVGRDSQRLGVWVKGREPIGAGDFENVGVSLEDVLREFPIYPPPPEMPNLKDFLRETVKKKGKLTQKQAVEIARSADFGQSREKILDLLQLIQGKQKPGPKGPRKNRAGKSA